MHRYRLKHSENGSTLLNTVIVISLIILVLAVLFPVVMRSRETAIDPHCQGNLKELATAVQMYWNDYGGMLPSSVLHQSKRTGQWDPKASAEFCSERGPVPPPKHMKPEDVRWVQLLWPYFRNADVIWCYEDPKRNNPTNNAQTLVSYFYRPAIDRAWFTPKLGRKMDHYRHGNDFEFTADQVVFFESMDCRGHKGWINGLVINAAFLDGHVRNIRLKDAVDCAVPQNAEELTWCMSLPGEPLWFNYDNNKSSVSAYKGDKNGVYWNPKKYCDMLP